MCNLEPCLFCGGKSALVYGSHVLWSKCKNCGKAKLIGKIDSATPPALTEEQEREVIARAICVAGDGNDDFWRNELNGAERLRESLRAAGYELSAIGKPAGEVAK